MGAMRRELSDVIVTPTSLLKQRCNLDATIAMSAIDRYIIRVTLLAFLMVLVSLTGIIWITQALRGLDLMTGQGQTILVFLGVTGLGIPVLAMIIAPIALLIAVTFTLNRLTTESEIIVMNAAGLSPWRFLRPFLIATLGVSIFVASLSLYFVPNTLRSLRLWQEDIGADVLTNILRPGEFAKLGALTLAPSQSQEPATPKLSSSAEGKATQSASKSAALWRNHVGPHRQP